MRVNNIQNIIAASTRMNATINSAAVQLNQVFSFSIQVFFTGTPTGSFKLQASCDANSGNNNPINWTDVANSSFSVSAAGNVQWDYSTPGFNWVRVVYSDGSSAASTAIITTATANIKGI